MTKSISKKTLINDYSKSLKSGSASLFIGSGISRKANYVGWKDILKECAEDIGLDVNKENDLITLAQYYVREKQRTKITEKIKDFFADNNGKIQEVHRIIASLPLNDVWTTNYDTLIERSFEEAKISTTILTDDNSYRNIDRNAKVKIHKIHGTVKEADKCVISRQDYDSFPYNHDIVMSELKGEMCSNSFLFLGYSFSDTDIQHILTKIRLEYDKSHPQSHYCIIQKNKKESNESEEDFEYRNILQDHHIADMQSYGINVLLVDSYDEIENILIEIRNKVNEKNVFISGAYENNESNTDTISLIAKKLSYYLIENNFIIYTGFGKNLGSDIIEGAHDGYAKNKMNFNDFNKKLVIIPFPYKKIYTEKKEKIYDDIRNYLASKTRILIVITGNKNKKLSNGTYKEYKKAINNNSLIIPIASFGGTAKIIWNELNQNEKYNKNQSFQQLINETNPENICDLVKNIIKEIG